MGLLDELGVGSVNLDIGSIFRGATQIIVLILSFVVVCGITFFILRMKKNKNLDKEKIHWFEEVQGEMIPIDDDIARELTIPGTNIQVFYIKKKDLYLPRLRRKMGKNSYWVGIKSNGELVNFTLKNINEEMSEANLDFDHTDMRYALTNLKNLIQRNYRDKSQPWWREYKDVISLSILIFVMSLSFFFIVYQIGGLIDKIGLLIDNADKLVKSAQGLSGSGVKTG